MAIKVKARETLIKVGPYQNTYRFVLNAELYSMLSSSKVIAEAALRSGLSKGVMNAAWEAIGNVISAWATEGHSVAIPGLGTMRFGLNAKSVAKVDDVSSELITTRKVIYTPSASIKQELKNTSVSITCYDRDGKIIKTVTSTDDGEVEEPKEKFVLNLESNPANGGTTTGEGEYEEGSQVEIEAVPAQGYKFLKWSDDVTDAKRTVTVNQEMELTALFEQEQAQTPPADNQNQGGTTPPTGGGSQNTGDDDDMGA